MAEINGANGIEDARKWASQFIRCNSDKEIMMLCQGAPDKVRVMARALASTGPIPVEKIGSRSTLSEAESEFLLRSRSPQVFEAAKPAEPDPNVQVENCIADLHRFRLTGRYQDEYNAMLGLIALLTEDIHRLQSAHPVRDVYDTLFGAE